MKDQELKESCCSSDLQADKQESTCCSNEGDNQTLKSSCCSSGSHADSKRSEETVSSNPDSTATLREYKVTGMDCPSCALTIEKSLGNREGIESVQVHYGTAKMVVGAESAAIHDAVPKQVRKLGFEAESMSPSSDLETYRIQGMDCGSCAATIEKHLSKHPDVREVRVHFSTGKMQIGHATNSKEVIKEVEKAGFEAALENDEEAVRKTGAHPLRSTTTLSGIFLALGFLSSFLPIPSYVAVVSYALTIGIGGWKPARSAFYAVKSKSLDMNVLMASAALGAALIGEWFEGAMVVWLFALGNSLQNRSIERTRDSIRSLINLTPKEATIKENDRQVRKAVEAVNVNEIMIIKPGEKIPLDGEVISGSSSVNQAPITGESMPVDKQTGNIVYAGTVNESGSLEVVVTKLVEDTTISKIIHLVEEAQEQKAPTQAFVDRFANVYTPIVFALALLVMVVPPLFGFGSWGEWLYKGLALLVVACPCALVISTPVAIVSAIGNAAKNGVLIKGGTFLEKAGLIEAVAFDKTGTLTEGKPKVTHVVTETHNEETLISIARTIEEHSTHPIAQAVTTYAEERGIVAQKGTHFGAIPGEGAEATIDGVLYRAGKPKLFDRMGVPIDHLSEQIASLKQSGHTIILIGTDREVMGLLAVSDTIRDITVQSIQSLKEVGLREMVMLTGDNEGTAKKISSEAGVDRYFAELLPEDKVEAVKTLQREGKQVAMVGDGINDAPALATADLGIAMGGAGTDTAMETADVVLMADNLEKLPHTIRLSRKALAIIKQNVWFSLLTKLAALLLIFPGFLTLWMAVISDTGAALLVILNSMRLLKIK
ncbi:cadmium-translocating P-type ATPase [Halobacillus litoralis]|uniref:heavy metal translocating P-type ATPase n=1 Tax=Halobacillus litoralis TaxID=45668 RepID=UPI001CD43E04|nr:heavy metal translocating P-type ATPase [Halobacillus litoralis]MCA0970443.1 cadmium-translocating P-type ATPase [Halobacillus litoralis]